ncbi:helix-turn-helix domain-containing protein [Nocardia jinanensis]|uniref:Transcriptional regulator n=1 Tax=Nocardia jinanensis TaxID=382504 RepID=A0A917RVG5_9NOCA|nr:helix-turn-helix transcriptional regulator [Nocardia jinanensis]GGL36695.1 transcriptional regulator [Nocardia jinanensis]
MDEQAHAIGRRVRYWRLRRNLDRQQFADMVGRSTSWLDKIEKGERNLLRLPMLDRVAEVLGVDPAALTDISTARRTVGCVDAVEVRTIREALSRYPSLSAQDSKQEPTLDRVTKQLKYVDQAWLSSHFTVVVRYLPRLLHEARMLAYIAQPSQQIPATRTLVLAYRLASSVLLKFETNDVAWLAADRAMQEALAVDDTLALARATRSVARSLTSTGQLTSAINAVTGMTDRMQPELDTRADELLSLYGMLFLAASIAAADQEDADTALLMHEQARAAAERLCPGYDMHRTFFGPTNVGLHRVAALVRLHEPGQALEYAQTIDQESISNLPPERRVNYMLDIASAYTQTGQYTDAARTLIDADRIAPEEVRCRPLSHGLLRAMLKNTGEDTGRAVRRIASRAGVTA